MSMSTVAAESRCPEIPPELISLILTKLWEQPLSSHERSISLQNTVLVNRTWLTLVAPIASRDTHIFSVCNTRAFLTSLRKELPHRDLFSNEASRFVDEICRSVTFHLDGDAPHGLLPYEMDPFALFMYAFSFQPHWLPALRHISVQYTDWEYDNILNQMRCESVPPQVTHLSVDYAFSDPALAVASECATTQRWFQGGKRRPVCYCPSIRYLSLAGIPPAFMAVMLHEYLNLETLEIAHPVQLAALAPLRPPVRTLVLCHPGVAISKTTMASWALDAALDAGLFGEGTKRPRIVVRSGTPDPVAFTRWKQICKGFDVDLVYERDDSRRRGC